MTCRAHAVGLLLIVAATTLQCGGDGSPIGPSPPPTAVWRPEVAWAHLDELLGVMRQHSANAGRIDWEAFRAAVMTAAGAGSAPDIPAAVSVALRLLDDQESYYAGRSGGVIGPSPVGGCRAPTGAVNVPENIGYVRVRGCDCQADAEIARFAESIQNAIRTADRAGLAGWIVDIRGNGGGNMWPMIAGIGPVLGEGIVGWIVYNNREYEREYVNGGAQSFGDVFARVELPYTLQNPFPKVAVLTDGSVVSAGEAVVVFFKNRLLTRSFGMATCGHHHLMQEFALGDGSALVLVTARHADRRRVLYSGPVQPDEIVTDPTEAVERAVAWLQARP
jgi:hypothetical protein